nr:putative ribonuclease H-like domain-containing protein [Tanacetum cinerariifolium]
LDHLIESQRSDQVKEGVGYNDVPPPTTDLYLSPKKDLSWTGLPEFVDDTVTNYSRPSPTVVSTSAEADLYLSPKKDLSWTSLPEFVDDTVTDYSRPSPTVASTSAEGQNKYSSTSKDVASPNTPKPFVKFVKPKDSQSESPEFVLKKKACYNCGDFSHLANDCRKRAHGAPMRPPHRSVGHRPHGPLMNPITPNMNGARPNRSYFIQAPSYETRPFLKSSAVKTQYRASWVPTVNRNNPLLIENFPLDSGCSRHMTGKISYLSDFEPFDGGYVSFGQGGCKITGKGTIKTGKLEFENVYFVKDLKYNLFSVSQICDNKNSVLFTNAECIVLGRNFKLLDDANILLRTHRQHNMYSIDLNNIVPHKDLTCLVAKASADECILWHRRLGHLNVKTMNKLVRHNLVRGLPTNSFDNDHTCTACLKGKQHKAFCKSKLVNSVTKPLHILHMDLFGPTS